MTFLVGTRRLVDVCVLVVEGAAAVRDVVVLALELSGARVIAVDSAVEGLAVLEREMPDVIVTSLSMPGHDGYWFLREVRSLPAERGGRTPMAAFTGSTAREDRLKALSGGPDGRTPGGRRGRCAAEPPREDARPDPLAPIRG